MKKQTNKFIAVSYQLHADENEGMVLVEEATEAQPYQFISGFGLTLDLFEDALINLQAGQEFEVKLAPEQAYGHFQPEHVLDLEREVFTVNGTFDAENIYEGAVVPLQNEEGTRFMGRILEVNDKQVKVDLNHPLAGKTLNFKGKVIENREATNEEIAAMVNQMAGGCGCGGHSDGGCCCGGCGSSDDVGCGCGH